VHPTSHPLAEEIYQRSKERVADISRMTVYNTLRALVEAGEIREVEPTLERGARYDTDTSTHHHLSCLRCHTIVDLHRPIDGLDIPVPEAAGYRIVRRQVTFCGYCPACQRQEAD
jgi:Fe2+ or Zn2+ uptake regulation protein